MDQRRMGKGMIIVGWVALLAVFTLVFSFIQDGRDNPNQNPESFADAEKVLVRLAGTSKGHYVATGSINNRPVDFLVDTGATYVAVPETVARTLRLERGRKTQVSTANGVADAWYTTLDRLAIGEIVLHNVDALITPGLSNKTLLGMSALRNLRFSQEGRELVLTQYRR